MDYGHSDDCVKLSKPIVANFIVINIKIKKYKKLRQELKVYLYQYPLITLRDFKVYAQKTFD